MDTGSISGSIITAVVIIIIISAILFGIWVGFKIRSSAPPAAPSDKPDTYNRFNVDDIEFDNPDPLEPASVKPFGSSAGAPVGSPAYDNFKTYKKGDVVSLGGKEYEMTETIGAAGYAPTAHPTSWKLKSPVAPPVSPPYDNFRTYKKGDVVSLGGKEYEMTNTIGAAGYAPTAHPTSWKLKTEEHFDMPTSAGPPSTSEPVALPSGTSFYVPASFPMESTAAAPLPYDNGRTYKEGDLVFFKGDTYKMIKPIGAAGYTPIGYAENWKLIPSPVKADTVPLVPTSGPPPYDNVKQYNLGDVVSFNGKTYKMTKYLGQSGGDPAGYYASYWTDTSLLNTPTPPPAPKYSSPTNFIMTGDDISDYVPVLQIADFGKGKVYFGQNGTNIAISNQDGQGMSMLGSLKDYNNMNIQSFQQLMLRNMLSGNPPQQNKKYIVKDMNGKPI